MAVSVSGAAGCSVAAAREEGDAKARSASAGSLVSTSVKNLWRSVGNHLQKISQHARNYFVQVARERYQALEELTVLSEALTLAVHPAAGSIAKQCRCTQFWLFALQHLEKSSRIPQVQGRQIASSSLCNIRMAVISLNGQTGGNH